jgi:hypothetical protein
MRDSVSRIDRGVVIEGRRVEMSIDRLPERATMSLAERPTLVNFCTRVATPEVGAGRLLLAAWRLAVRLSFRPTSTCQLGPPDCIGGRSISL